MEPERYRLGRRLVALVFLLVVLLWSNLAKNVANWAKGNQIPPDLLGLGAKWWFLLVGVLLSAVVIRAIALQHRGRLALAPMHDLGRGQVLFLLLLWIPVVGAFTQALPGMSNRGVFLVHVSFWVTAGICSLLVVSMREEMRSRVAESLIAPEAAWRLGRGFRICLCLIPLLLYGAAYLTMASHEGPLPGGQLRFAPATTTSTSVSPGATGP